MVRQREIVRDVNGRHVALQAFAGGDGRCALRDLMFFGAMTLQTFLDVELFGFLCGLVWIVTSQAVHAKGMWTFRSGVLFKKAGTHGQTDRCKTNQDGSFWRKLRGR